MDADTIVTVGLILFGLWHLARAGLRRAAGWAAYAEPDPAPAVAAASAPDYRAYVAEPDPDSPLTADEWGRLLTDEANTIPHLAAYGPSGAGKSTFVLALLKRRPGQLVITTIKNEADDPWGGFPAVRLGFKADEDGEIEPDWSNIRAAIDAVYREANLRHADGARPRTPLTLVVDELTATVAACGDKWLVPRLIHLWLTARSVGVRLIVMDPTANVKGWGLDGRGDVRESIGFVRCERDRSVMLGTLEECRAGTGIYLETHEVPALAAGPLAPDRVWTPGRSVLPGPAPEDYGATLHAPPLSEYATPYEVELIAAWRREGETSLRALARRLYRARGGADEYDGSGRPFYAVKAALSEDNVIAV